MNVNASHRMQHCAIAGSLKRHIFLIGVSAMLIACSEKPPAPKVETLIPPPAVIAAPPPKATPVPMDANKELATRVKSALESELGVAAAAGIDVKASNGAVKLFGTVSDAAEQRKAGSVASAVSRVTSVDNQLVIARGS